MHYHDASKGVAVAKSLDHKIAQIRSEWPIGRALEHYGHDTGNGILTTCPFCYSMQKTPDKTFHYTDQLWHCFYSSCPSFKENGKSGGDVFTLVQALEGCSFVDAVKLMSGSATTVAGRNSKMQAPVDTIWNAFTYQDILRERADFLKLEEMIARDHRHRLKMVEVQHKTGAITAEEAEWKKGTETAKTEILYSELDRIRCQLLYYLGCEVKGTCPAYPGHPKKKKRRL